MEKSDEIESPFWYCFLSTRVSNALFGEFRKGRCKMSYRSKTHDHVNIDFDSHTDETIRPLFKKLLEDKLIFVKRIRGLGEKGLVEFYEWCGYMYRESE